jgi:hypothetical protein
VTTGTLESSSLLGANFSASNLNLMVLSLEEWIIPEFPLENGDIAKKTS